VEQNRNPTGTENCFGLERPGFIKLLPNQASCASIALSFCTQKANKKRTFALSLIAD
jgi:hypothetical protein